ncbi:MAG: HEPN domain-containing protein [Bacteroidales bacterium]|nr:HEPN domain-containing protein [Bacteroidales bacterium]
MIDLTKILSYLPESKVTELETVTKRIVNTGNAEIVILFGSYARGDYKEKRRIDQGRKSDYDILVVVSDYETKKELRTELRAVFKDISVHVQLIVEEIHYVNNSLEEKQFFFTDIKREGKVLFNSGKFELSDSKELTPTRRREIAEEDFKEWFEMASAFFNGHKETLKNDNNKSVFLRKASFELQQAVEMCYTAIELVFTHYNPYEHNLEILRERVLQFDSRIKEFLPYETKEQKELFDYLNFAYIGGRYRSKKDFPVTQEQLDYWKTEVKQLLDLTETICKERIDCLRGIEKRKS